MSGEISLNKNLKLNHSLIISLTLTFNIKILENNHIFMSADQKTTHLTGLYVLAAAIITAAATLLAVKWANSKSEADSSEASEKIMDITFTKAIEYYLNDDYVLAFSNFKQAADKGNVDALYFLGRMYEHGEGVPRDRAKAESYYLSALDKGDIKANYGLGSLALFTIPADSLLANSYFSKSFNAIEESSKNSDFWKINLACMYLFANGIPKDVEKGQRLLLQTAKMDYARVQYLLAENYLMGIGTRVDSVEALHFYKECSKHNSSVNTDGYVEAKIGEICSVGIGGWKDLNDALHWWTIAAQKGNAYSQIQLANAYMSKSTPDSAKAFYYAELGLKSGSSEAELTYGMCFLVYRSNTDQFIFWTTKAANRGNTLAQYMLGCYYRVRDPQLAKSFFEKAAEKGLKQAVDSLNAMGR